jgi:hypothetical protein
MSGLVDVDPDHPLVFALVTNTKRPLSKAVVRKAHDQVIGALCTYVAKTSKANPLVVTPPAAPAPAPALGPAPTVDPEDVEHDPMLDAETSGAE